MLNRVNTHQKRQAEIWTKMKINRVTEVSLLVQLFTETLLNYLYFDEQLNISQS